MLVMADTATTTPIDLFAAQPGLMLDEHQLSAAINVNVKTLRNWRSLHQGPPSLKLVGTVRYRAGDVVAWILDENGRS